MNVKELKEKLKEYPNDAIVYLDMDQGRYGFEPLESMDLIKMGVYGRKEDEAKEILILTSFLE